MDDRYSAPACSRAPLKLCHTNWWRHVLWLYYYIKWKIVHAVCFYPCNSQNGFPGIHPTRSLSAFSAHYKSPGTVYATKWHTAINAQEVGVTHQSKESGNVIPSCCQTARQIDVGTNWIWTNIHTPTVAWRATSRRRQTLFHLPGSLGEMSHSLQTMCLILLSVYLRRGGREQTQTVWLTYILCLCVLPLCQWKGLEFERKQAHTF